MCLDLLLLSKACNFNRDKIMMKGAEPNKNFKNKVLLIIFMSFDFLLN